MLTGIFGAVMGYKGYRQSSQIKALDMRLELQRDLSEVRESIPTLRGLMTSCISSRKASMAARGISMPGVMGALEKAVQDDRETVQTIAASIRSEGSDFTALSESQLEAELVAVHKIKTNLATLTAKYRRELEADEAAKRQLAQQNAAMTAARMSRTPPQNFRG
jgi:hypothetical protein